MSQDFIILRFYYLPEKPGHMAGACAQKGYPLIGASDHFFSEAIYLSDPDGIGVEIYADRPQDIWVGEHGELKGGGNAP